MRFQILGGLAVSSDRGDPVGVAGPKRRALLAVLLLRANEVVAAERLIDELWGETPPPSAAKSLQVHIWGLRKDLGGTGAGGGPLATAAGGYLLHVEPGQLDMEVFERLLSEGRAAVADGRPEAASATLAQALALWHGPPLGEFAGQPFARDAIARLEELRMEALEARIDADLALGREHALVAELAGLVGRNRTRERLRAQLMLALYRCGRQAEALDVYQEFRRALAAELGLNPSPSLRQLEGAILNRDASLELPPATGQRAEPDAPTSASRAVSGRRHGLRLAAAASLVIAIVIVGAVLPATDHAARASTLAADTVGAINPRTGAISAEIPVGSAPSRLAAGDGALWVTNYSDNTVSRIDPTTNTLHQTVPVGAGPSGIAIGGGTVWVANNFSGTVSRIDTRSGKVVQTIAVGNAPTGVAIGNGSVWVTNSADATVRRIDAVTGAAIKTIALGGGATDVAAGLGSVWVTDEAAGRVLRIDPQTDRVIQAINVGGGPSAIEVGDGAVWVANSRDGTVSKIDPQSNAVTAAIAVGDGPNAIAVGVGGVWVANEFAGSVSRIDPATDQVARTIKVGNRPKGIAITGDRVWVSAQAAATSHRGGTLTLLSNAPFDSIDPAVALSVPSIITLGMTSDGLTAFKRVGGSDGLQVVPDLAISLPTPTDGGTTYSFQLRPAIRYSNGMPVRPEDFRFALERDLKLGSPEGAHLYNGVLGGAACIAHPARCDLSKGIVTDDAARRVTFHLIAPDPEFLDKLAVWSGVAVPVGTSAHPVDHALPATGAYVVAGYAPGREVRLVRNPYFREWSQAARPDGYPDQIVWRLGESANAEVTAVEHGNADYTFDGSPPKRLTEVQTRYASQVHSSPGGVTTYLAINTRVPPFTDLRVRRALNYALDRRKIATMVGAAEPTCQLLPPYLPGYQPYCPYTLHPNSTGTWLAPDLATAERLIAASHTRGMRIAVWSQPGYQTDYASAGRYVVSLLDRLGYRASLRTFAASDTSSYFRFGDPRTRAQLAFIDWSASYPSPSEFIKYLFSCGAFQPHSTTNPNWSEFCDPHVDAEIQNALTAEGANSPAAPRFWAQADRQLTDQAPLVPLVNPISIELLSRRVGNYQLDPQYGVIPDQLWVR